MRHDLPAGGRRMVMQARGMQYTIVNGEVLYEEQKHTGALPGRVLRAKVTAPQFFDPAGARLHG